MVLDEFEKETSFDKHTIWDCNEIIREFECNSIQVEYLRYLDQASISNIDSGTGKVTYDWIPQPRVIEKREDHLHLSWWFRNDGLVHTLVLDLFENGMVEVRNFFAQKNYHEKTEILTIHDNEAFYRYNFHGFFVPLSGLMGHHFSLPYRWPRSE